MIYFTIILLLGTIGCLIWYFVDDQDQVVFIYMISCSVMTFIFLLWSCIYIIQPGHVGIEVLFGAIQNYTENGMHLQNPFSSIEKFDVRTQKISIEADSASQDLQAVKVITVVNYHLQYKKISSLYKNVGIDYENKVLIPAIAECVKAATAKYKVEDIIIKRHELKENVVAMLKNKLNDYYITLEDVTLQHIDFSSEFNKVVEEKQIEEQKIKTAEYKRLQAENEKKTVILEAEAEARKQQLLRQSTDKNVISLKWIEKWDGSLPTTILGDKSIMMIQPKENKE